MEDAAAEVVARQIGFNILAWGAGITVLAIVLMIWTMVWKGIALWRAGRNNQLGWFIVLFLINTIGILEILYIFVFQPKEKKPE